MARGKPDYHRSTVIEAKKDTTFQPVILDANGHMFIALTGQEIKVNNLADIDETIKGKAVNNFPYVALDSTGIILARMKGSNDQEGLKDVAVDTEGLMLARIQGSSTEGLKDVYVDTSGKMIARVQGVGGGLEPLFTIDDGGDENLISEWEEEDDGLDPVDLEGFGKEGQHAMKLGIDASLTGNDYGSWVKTTSVGDLFQYTARRLYIWIYFNSIEFLKTVSKPLQYLIGSSPTDYIYWNFQKGELTQGWNLLACEFAHPTGTGGTIDYTNITYQRLMVWSLPNNTHDYYMVIDLICIVKPNPQAWEVIDVATDKDGLMLSKMVGSYGELHKPINADRFGNLRTNLTNQGLWTVVANQFRGHLQTHRVLRHHDGLEVFIMCDLKGPGIVMGGSCIHIGPNSHKECYVRFICDGNIFQIMNFEDLNTYNLTKAWEYVPHLTLYDDTNYIYAVSFPNNLSFESQFKVEAIEFKGSPSSTELILFYAIV